MVFLGFSYGFPRVFLGYQSSLSPAPPLVTTKSLHLLPLREHRTFVLILVPGAQVWRRASSLCLGDGGRYGDFSHGIKLYKIVDISLSKKVLFLRVSSLVRRFYKSRFWCFSEKNVNYLWINFLKKIWKFVNPEIFCCQPFKKLMKTGCCCFQSFQLVFHTFGSSQVPK